MQKQNSIEVPAKKEGVAEEPPKTREELEKKKSPEQERLMKLTEKFQKLKN